jgi:phosphatidylglycerophosphatase A
MARPTAPLTVKLIGSGFLTGYSPVASGTVASALALALYFAVPWLSHPIVLPIVSIVTFMIGVRVAGIMERMYGHDPAEVTIDEVVGMWLSLVALPVDLLIAVSAFFLFRFFDIVKPFPARRLDSMRGGLGIMLDDVIAAAYTNMILQILLAFSFFDLVKTIL